MPVLIGIFCGKRPTLNKRFINLVYLCRDGAKIVAIAFFGGEGSGAKILEIVLGDIMITHTHIHIHTHTHTH